MDGWETVGKPGFHIDIAKEYTPLRTNALVASGYFLERKKYKRFVQEQITAYSGAQ